MISGRCENRLTLNFGRLLTLTVARAGGDVAAGGAGGAGGAVVVSAGALVGIVCAILFNIRSLLLMFILLRMQLYRYCNIC